MEDLRKRVEELEAKHGQLEEESAKVYKELEEAKELLCLEELKTIDENDPIYTKKLERLKTFMDAYLEENPYYNEVTFAFKKQEEPYRGDSHEIIQDPLDWMVGEYDLLGMNNFMEIIFEYHTEAVKNFVLRWMKEHAEYANESSLKGLYKDFSK
jgi:hypothetical protein